MIKLIMIYDQVQAGLGTKDDRMVPLGASREVIGPALMMKPYLKEIDAKVIACLSCGTGTYALDPDEVKRKLCVMVQKVGADAVICGPSFNYPEYSEMCAEVADEIQQKTGVPALAAMAAENKDIIEVYDKKITIITTPKKGEAGLNDALKKLCYAVQEAVSKNSTKIKR